MQSQWVWQQVWRQAWPGSWQRRGSGRGRWRRRSNGSSNSRRYNRRPRHGRRNDRPTALRIQAFLGLGSIVGAFFGGPGVAEHQQQVTAAVQGGGRYGANNGERLAGIVDHFLDRRHRVTCREALAEAGTDQQVAFLDVGGIGHVTQFKALRVAGAAGNGAQTVAVNLHRNAMGGVGQQQDPGGVGHQLDHLAHQATGIEYRLTEHHAVALTFVDDDAMGERVGVHADQFGHFDLFVDQRRRVEQLAQPNVLLGEGGKLLHASLQQQVFALEFFVFGDEFGTAAKLAGHTLP